MLPGATRHSTTTFIIITFIITIATLACLLLGPALHALSLLPISVTSNATTSTSVCLGLLLVCLLFSNVLLVLLEVVERCLCGAKFRLKNGRFSLHQPQLRFSSPGTT